MRFPRSFFEDEVRDGFYVPALMKRCWAAQMEVWEAVSRICDRHAIPCYAYAGTLLGAVRHGGFIPWDDDMDFCMLREDFARFNAIAERELPEGYFFLNYQTDEGWDEPYTRIVSARQVRMDASFLSHFHGFPFSAGIEIFPLDYLAADEEDEQLRESLFAIATYYGNAINEENRESPEIQEKLRWMEETLRIHFDRAGNLRQQLYLLAERLAAMYPREGAAEVANMAYWTGKRSHRYRLSDFSGLIALPFEGMQIPAPSGYDGILHSLYGEYMVASYSGNEHDYPYYKGQMGECFQQIREAGESCHFPGEYTAEMAWEAIREQQRQGAVTYADLADNDCEK